ncbi:hypothetical protein RintRC_4368 [Richelia intracellularis]|nr:hypothetical protein RintRC_4368 [Richelia intracellularis]
MLDLMWSGDGDIPLYLRVAHGNEVDSAMFGTLMASSATNKASICLYLLRMKPFTLKTIYR